MQTMRAGSRAGRRRSSGFTLVEILVALVVLSIGMLGIAALYLESLRSGRAALYRTQAINLAADLGDRIRANRAALDAYDCGDPCDPTAGGNAMAIADLSDWIDNIQDTLPGGVGSVVYTEAVPNVPTAYDLTVTWDEVGYEEPLSYSLRVEI